MNETSGGRLSAALARLFGVEAREFVAVAWSFVYFFCLLASYFMLRSVRETMAIVGGTENIPWLFTGTFVVMLLAAPVFGWVASRYPRKRFLPWIYYFFIVNILLFYAAFQYAHYFSANNVWISRVFFVWLSVFNLFVVSVFWSFMADIYSKEQGRRLFGLISAGGSIGAILGPLLTTFLVVPIGFQNMLPLSALLLLLSVICITKLRHWAVQTHSADEGVTVNSAKPIGGTALAGIRLVASSPYLAAIATALVIANFMGVATYMYMAKLIGETFATSDRQTQVFAMIDATINGFAFVGQLLIVKHSVRKLGVGYTLAILPVVSILCFALVAIQPVFLVLAVVQILRRSITFGLTKPTTNMLYSVVSPEERYKAKNFIETAVYRGGDVVATWIVRFIGGIGLNGIALLCVPLAVVWTLLAFRIGRGYLQRDNATPQGETA